MKKKADPTAAQLAADIARITGKRPRSRDADYLAQRLAELRRNVTFGVSMTAHERAALDKIEKREATRFGQRSGVSGVVRRALALYAQAREYPERVAFADAGVDR